MSRDLIRKNLVVICVAMLAACSSYRGTVNAIGETFEAPRPALPKVDLTNAEWKKLAPEQPDANPLRAAVVARDETIGATRVVIKAPPNFRIPPYWFTSQGTYMVLKGTFVVDTMDGYGRTKKLRQGPGAFDTVPANFIQRVETAPGEEGLLYVTVYGEWSPRFAKEAWGAPSKLPLRSGS